MTTTLKMNKSHGPARLRDNEIAWPWRTRSLSSPVRREGRSCRRPRSRLLGFGLLNRAAERTLERAVFGRGRAVLGQLHPGTSGLAEPRIEDSYHALACRARNEPGQQHRREP